MRKFHGFLQISTGNGNLWEKTVEQLSNYCRIYVEHLFNGCLTIVQWLHNACFAVAQAQCKVCRSMCSSITWVKTLSSQFSSLSFRIALARAAAVVAVMAGCATFCLAQTGQLVSRYRICGSTKRVDLQIPNGERILSITPCTFG